MKIANWVLHGLGFCAIVLNLSACGTTPLEIKVGSVVIHFTIPTGNLQAV